jgi:hypothetical protein
MGKKIANRGPTPPGRRRFTVRKRRGIEAAENASITLVSWVLIYLMVNSQIMIAFEFLWYLLGERSAAPSMRFYMLYRLPMVLAVTSLLTSLGARGWVMAAVADGLAVCHEAAKSVTGLSEVSLLWTDLPLMLHLLVSVVASATGCLMGTRLHKSYCEWSSKRSIEGKNFSKRKQTK